jgi:antitoxin component YwqK of YwqJK toxin-antitoxin module
MKYLAALFLLGLLHIGYSQHLLIKQNTVNAELKGNVKSVLKQSVMILTDSSRYIGSEIISEYNQFGNEISYKFYSGSKKKKISDILRIYDSSQNLSEVIMYGDSTVIERRLYEYDSMNRETKESMFYGNGYMFQKSLFFYNALGQLSEAHLYSSNTNFLLKKIFDYDKNGNQISMKIFYRNNILAYEYLYRYDKNNNKIEMIYNHYKDSIKQITRYQYNKNNKVIKLVQFDKNLLVSELQYKYDQNGIEIECIAIGVQSKSKYISRKNEKGLIIESLDYKNDSLETRQTYWYEYDATGNWTTQYNSYNGSRPSIMERYFEYY